MNPGPQTPALLALMGSFETRLSSSPNQVPVGDGPRDGRRPLLVWSVSVNCGTEGRLLNEVVTLLSAGKSFHSLPRPRPGPEIIGPGPRSAPESRPSYNGLCREHQRSDGN